MKIKPPYGKDAAIEEMKKMKNEEEKCEYGTKEDCDRPETVQPRKASREIDLARRNLAKAVNAALDHKVGDKRLAELYDLARVIEVIR